MASNSMSIIAVARVFLSVEKAILPSPKSRAWNHTDQVTLSGRRVYTLLPLMASPHLLVALSMTGAGLYRKGSFAITPQRQSRKTIPRYLWMNPLWVHPKVA